MSKNTYSLAELKAKAKDAIKGHDKVFATSDGQFFPTENSAQLHAKPNKLKVYEIGADVLEEDKPDAKKPAEKKAKETGK